MGCSQAFCCIDLVGAALAHLSERWYDTCRIEAGGFLALEGKDLGAVGLLATLISAYVTVLY